MRIGYLYNLTMGLAAGFLVVATQAFASTTAAWLTFAVAVFAALISAGVVTLPRMGIAQRMIGGTATLIGIWTIVASLVFAPGTVVWLGFASALALLGLSLVGLTAHELSTERVVHSLELAHETPSHEHVREPIAA